MISRRVPVPIGETFRQIAKLEKRSVAAQAALVLDEYTRTIVAQRGSTAA
jgi:hypothetical protein